MLQGLFPGYSVDGIGNADGLVHRTGELGSFVHAEPVVQLLYIIYIYQTEQEACECVAGFPPEQRDSFFKFFDRDQGHQPFQGLGGSILAYSSRSLRMVTMYTSASITTITAPI